MPSAAPADAGVVVVLMRLAVELRYTIELAARIFLLALMAWF